MKRKHTHGRKQRNLRTTISQLLTAFSIGHFKHLPDEDPYPTPQNRVYKCGISVFVVIALVIMFAKRSEATTEARVRI